jgi:hypothetical protein
VQSARMVRSTVFRRAQHRLGPSSSLDAAASATCFKAAANAFLHSTKAALEMSHVSMLFGSDNNEAKTHNNAWTGGSEQLIRWTFRGVVPEVMINLHNPNSFTRSTYVGLLARKVRNTGSHVVSVPAGLVPGHYFLKIVSESDARVFATSSTFTIDKEATVYQEYHAQRHELG